MMDEDKSFEIIACNFAKQKIIINGFLVENSSFIRSETIARIF